MRIVELFIPYFMCIILVVISSFALNQRYHYYEEYEVAKHTIEQHELVIDSWETICKTQDAEISHWIRENQGLAEDIDKQNEAVRGYKARAEALEGRIRKMAGAYHVREMNLLAEIGRLEKKLQKVHDTWKKSDANLYTEIQRRELELLEQICQLKAIIRSGVLPPLEVDENGEVIRPKFSPGFPVGKGKHDGWIPPYTETDDGQHNQSEARSRVAHPERPDQLSEDTGVGCRGDARERFSTRHPRLVPLQKRVRRKMGRR